MHPCIAVCGRIVRVFDRKLGAWVTRHDANWDRDETLAKRVRETSYNVPPLSWFPVLGPGASRLQVAQWGFPAPGRAGRVINTRVETAATSPFWRSLVGRGNCVVPVTGFYEWEHSGPTPQPHFVRRKDGDVMALAALAGLRDVDGGRRLVVSILTREPDSVVGRLHDRMPVVLEPGEVEAWVGGAGLDLVAGPRPALEAYPVSTAVNPATAEGPQLIEPVPRQTRLV